MNHGPPPTSPLGGRSQRTDNLSPQGESEGAPSKKNIMTTKSQLILALFALVLTTSAAAQETLFPANHSAPAEFTTGRVHISVLSRSERQLTTNFLFERGSRNSWHYHPHATQVLMVLSGEAYYQEEGKPKQLLRRGDVVTTPPDVRHWNGATPWSDCECITVSDLVAGQQHAVQLHKVSDTEFASPVEHTSMIVRLAEIEVHPEHLADYLELANQVDRLSVEREPGVVCLFPMQSADNPTHIRILEIYASEEAYQSHIKTDHFQAYKQSTQHMVKSLKLPTMRPLDPETMNLIFSKQR